MAEFALTGTAPFTANGFPDADPAAIDPLGVTEPDNVNAVEALDATAPTLGWPACPAEAPGLHRSRTTLSGFRTALSEKRSP